MASIKLRLRGNSKQANIYIRISLGRGLDIERKSGYTIDPVDWSKAKGKPIGRDENLKNLNTDLSDLINQLNTALNTALKNKVTINSKWLQNQIDIIHNLVPITNEELIVNYIQKIIDNAKHKKNSKGGLGLSKSRIKSYKTFQNTINRFQRDSNNSKDFAIIDVNLNFSEKFTTWLFSKNYSINYAGKNIDNLKAVCRDAKRNGIPTSDEVDLICGFSEKKDSDEIIILSDKEQDTIASLELESDSLINARKWLLLGCQVGQRYSDLIRIKKENIIDHKNLKIIELSQIKTSKKVAIPVLPKALEIIESGLPYPISNQKFNNYIKQICKQAEINTPTRGSKIMKTNRANKNKPKTKGVYPKWQLIGSHVCRRSFASNFYGKIPTPVIIGITQHSTEKTFLKYIGKTSYDNAEQMMQYFAKLETKQ